MSRGPMASATMPTTVMATIGARRNGSGMRRRSSVSIGRAYAPAERWDRGAMNGTMQDAPLTLPHFFSRAERIFPTKEVVTATPAGVERTTYGQWADRTRRLGGVLDEL